MALVLNSGRWIFKSYFRLHIHSSTQLTWVWGNWCLVQISLTQEIRRMNKNSLFGGRHLKKKSVIWKWENAMRMPRGGGIFLWQRAEWSESQSCNQFLQLGNCVKVGKWRIDGWGFWRSDIDMKVFKRLRQNFLRLNVSLSCSTLLSHKQVCSYWHLPRSKAISGAFICTAAQFIFVNISDGAPSLGLGTREGPLPRWRWSCG